jgi:ribokinase
VFLAGRDCPAEQVPAFKVNAVDTTAAGDCFNAAFAVALTRGKKPAEAARYAAAAAAISVTRAGAQPSLPSSSEVEAFLAQAS